VGVVYYTPSRVVGPAGGGGRADPKGYLRTGWHMTVPGVRTNLGKMEFIKLVQQNGANLERFDRRSHFTKDSVLPANKPGDGHCGREG